MNELRLRDLAFGARLALTLFVAVLAIGFGASAYHLREHHQNRDEQPGVSLEDITGAYHGVNTTAPLVSALERQHPPELLEGERELLLKWLRSGRIVEDYDNFDLGDAAPDQLLRKSCLECHARNSTKGDGIGAKVPLEYFDDVKKLAFSKSVAPVPLKVLAASTHTHALALASMSIVIGFLLLATRWPKALRDGLFALAGLGLLVDLACWWLARSSAALVPLLIGAGALYAGATLLSLALVALDLWWPRRD
ncbi:MAG: hypothetical protein IT454_06210 [Planctomycetes bacterium]|nr:hypothetical protein [Planctomycetota bacterium]